MPSRINHAHSEHDPEYGKLQLLFNFRELNRNTNIEIERSGK